MARGDSFKTAGKYCMVAGGVTFFMMALSTAVIFDVIFICAMWKQAREAARNENRNPIGSGIKLWVTYELWKLVSRSTNPLVLFLLSPFASIAAAALAVSLDVSFIAWGIAIGWGIGLALVLIGYGLYKLGQHLNEEKPPVPPAHTTEAQTGYLYRTMNRYGLFDVLPTAVATSIRGEAIPEAEAVRVEGDIESELPQARPVYR